MNNKLRTFVLVLSVSLNVAFIVAWSLQRLPARMQTSNEAGSQDGASAISSEFHRELGVTAQQWAQIKPLLAKFRDVATRQRQDIMNLREQLFRLLAASPVDKTALAEKQEELLSAQRRMQQLVMNHLLEEKAILTESQSERLIQTLFSQSQNTGGIQKNFGLERLWKDKSSHEATTHQKNVEEK